MNINRYKQTKLKQTQEHIEMRRIRVRAGQYSRHSAITQQFTKKKKLHFIHKIYTNI